MAETEIREIAKRFAEHDVDGFADVLLSIVDQWSVNREDADETQLRDVLGRLQARIKERRRSIRVQVV